MYLASNAYVGRLWTILSVVVLFCGNICAVGIDGFDERRALEMLKSGDAKSRTLVYRACRALGTEGREIYRGVLRTGMGYHERKIESSVELATEEANRFSGTLSKLRQQRQFALDFTLTDIDNMESKIVDLERAHADAKLWLEEAKAQHGRATASMGALNQSATAIDEILREQAFCAGEAVRISQRTFNKVLSKHSNYASNLHDRLGEQMAFHRVLQRYQKALKHNHAQTWATPEMRVFADILNEKRHVLGLSLLMLEPRLSSACAGHSKEMIKLNYFAHRSPVAENLTPERRASKVRYKGTFVGENIFFHATAKGARAAYDAWWRSDGHRFVMFDPKSDQLGVSDAPGTHWTMMTGLSAVPARVEEASLRR